MTVFKESWYYIRMKKLVPALLLSFLLILLSSLISYSAVISPEIETTLARTGTEQEIPVIITLKDKVDLTLFKDGDKDLLRPKLIKALLEKADSTQTPIKAFLAERGVKQIRSLWAINGVLFKATPRVIREVAEQPNIERIRLDQIQTFRDRFRGIRKYSPRLRSKVRTPPKKIDIPSESPVISADAKSEWNLSAIHASELWSKGPNGQGVVVANLDTGVDFDHPDLKSKWRGGKNSWFDPYGEHETPFDANGHGTQTMGIMIGGHAGGTAIGVAPGAKWIAVKIYNDSGQTSLGHCHLGFQWLLDPDGNPETDDSPDTVNFSWGFNQYTNKCVNEFDEDVRVLKAAQVTVIFAGGNEGPHPSTSLSPANHIGSLSVGAIEKSMHIATFSSRGPSACDGGVYPTLVAPGVIVKTADLTFNGVFPNSSATVTGTSFAAAHVTGAMALLKSAFPHLTISELESALRESAQDLGETGADHIYGYGMINLMAAYDYLLSRKK